MDKNRKKEKMQTQSADKNMGNTVAYKITVIFLSCMLVISAVFLVISWSKNNGDSANQNSEAHTSGTYSSIHTTQSSTTGTIQATQPEPERIDFSLTEFPEEIWLVEEACRALLSTDNIENVGDFLKPYMPNGVRRDVGLPVELSCAVEHLPETLQVSSIVFQLALCEDFSDAKDYLPEPGTYSVQIFGLFPGKQYYCRVYITLSDGTVTELNSTFRTAASPRILSIDGIVNVRDIGGWKTTDGRTIKMGLLYRGSELDGGIEPTFKLTEKGIAQMRELGIRMDMDLRHTGENILGDEVIHVTYTAYQYMDAFTPKGMEAIRRVFSDLAKPEHYPIYMHCTYGADRTGTICYLLEALLGVSDADLMRDYDLTGLKYCYISEQSMDEFVAHIATLEGSTTQEKVENFLLSIGVTQEEIDSIRNIFLE